MACKRKVLGVLVLVCVVSPGARAYAQSVSDPVADVLAAVHAPDRLRGDYALPAGRHPRQRLHRCLRAALDDCRHSASLPRGRPLRHSRHGPGRLRQHGRDQHQRRRVHLGLAGGSAATGSPGGLDELLGRPDHRQRGARAARNGRWDQRVRQGGTRSHHRRQRLLRHRSCGTDGTDRSARTGGSGRKPRSDGIRGTGDNGCAGIRGADWTRDHGPAGLQGAGFTWRGEFACAASYAPRDVISYQGSTWITNTAIGGCVQPPFSPWELLAAKGLDTTHAAPPCFDNANRYVNCGNGTVTDTVTGLIWLQNANCFSEIYSAANQAAAGLAAGQCGLTDGSSAGDWRLPTKAEWQATIARAVGLACSPVADQ